MGKKKERIRELELEVDCLFQDLCKVQDQLKAATDPVKAESQRTAFYNEGYRIGKTDAKDDFAYWLGVVTGSMYGKAENLEELKALVAKRLDETRKVE